jgi:hypothetical protein
VVARNDYGGRPAGRQADSSTPELGDLPAILLHSAHAPANVAASPGPGSVPATRATPPCRAAQTGTIRLVESKMVGPEAATLLLVASYLCCPGAHLGLGGNGTLSVMKYHIFF